MIGQLALYYIGHFDGEWKTGFVLFPIALWGSFEVHFGSIKVSGYLPPTPPLSPNFALSE